jgi:hypothetical protein
MTRFFDLSVIGQSCECGHWSFSCVEFESSIGSIERYLSSCDENHHHKLKPHTRNQEPPSHLSLLSLHSSTTIPIWPWILLVPSLPLSRTRRSTKRRTLENWCTNRFCFRKIKRETKDASCSQTANGCS